MKRFRLLSILTILLTWAVVLAVKPHLLNETVLSPETSLRLSVASLQSGDLATFAVGEAGPAQLGRLPGSPKDGVFAIAGSADGQFLYAANGDSNGVSVFTREIDGNLLLVQTLASGAAPRSLIVSPNGQYLYVANAADGNIAMFGIESGSGKLRLNGKVPTSGKPMGLTLHPSGKFLFSCNTGSNDVSIYSVDPNSGALKSVGLPVASGKHPMSVDMDPSGRLLLTANLKSSDISVFVFDQANASLSLVQTVTCGEKGSTAPACTGCDGGCRAVAISPKGDFAYVANAGSDDISVFAIEGERLIAKGQVKTGKTPVDIALSPEGDRLCTANLNSGSVSLFSIQDGVLTPTETISVGPARSEPISVLFESTQK